MPHQHASGLRFLRIAAAAAAIPAMVSMVCPSAAVAETGATDSNPRKFYVRAGVALDRSREARFEDEDCARPRPGNFYGCRRDGTPHGSSGDFGTMAAVELGLGYHASPRLRLEAGVQHRPRFTFRGHHSYRRTAPRSTSADASSVSVMLATYLDLGEPGGPGLGPFRPFIGGGIGLSRIKVEKTRLDFPKTTVGLPAGHQTNFAWSLTAGVATPLGERATLDLAWRYTHFGTVETGRGTGRTVCRTEGCGLESEYAVPETRADLRSHGLHVSIRYAF